MYILFCSINFGNMFDAHNARFDDNMPYCTEIIMGRKRNFAIVYPKNDNWTHQFQPFILPGVQFAIWHDGSMKF